MGFLFIDFCGENRILRKKYFICCFVIMKKDIVLFGMQWCGKGTQAGKLLELYPDDYAYLSTWDVFRALLSKDNAIGNYLKDKIESGTLIPDAVTVALFHTYFQTVLDGDKAMLLDWYPRTKEQIDDLFNIAGKQKRQMMGICFELSEELAIERMKLRGRSDDTDAAIRHRLQQYYDQTVPVIDYFDTKGELIRIDADRSIEKIFEDFQSVVNN